jgi:hypothetical protein
MNYLRVKRNANPSEEFELLSDPEPPELPEQVLAWLAPKRLAPWQKSAVKTVAFAETRSVGILGIAGISKDARAGEIAAAVARSYSDFGKRILLVEASDKNIDQVDEAITRNLLNLDLFSVPISKNLHYIHLDRFISLPQDPEYFKVAFEAALKTFHAIVVNLPVSDNNSDRPSPSMLAVGAACSSVLLACVTGRTTRQEIQQYLASCKISGTNIGGILLNDSRLPLNSLLQKT